MDKAIYDNRYFESISDGWNKISYEVIKAEIMDDCRLKNNNSVVLDIGCGVGLYNPTLIKDGNEYIGIDLSECAVTIARDKGYNAICGLAEKIPLGNETVDYVFSTEVIEHVDDPGLMLKEIKRVLKPGGSCLITTTTYQFIIFHYIWVSTEIGFKFRDLILYIIGYISKQCRDDFVRLLYNYTGGHLWGFMKKDLIHLVKSANLEVVDAYYINVQPIMPFKLQGVGIKKYIKMIVDIGNGIFLNKKSKIYGPNIILKINKSISKA